MVAAGCTESFPNERSLTIEAVVASIWVAGSLALVAVAVEIRVSE